MIHDPFCKTLISMTREHNACERHNANQVRPEWWLHDRSSRNLLFPVADAEVARLPRKGMRARVLCMCCETSRSATDLKAPCHADAMVSAALEGCERQRTARIPASHAHVTRQRHWAAARAKPSTVKCSARPHDHCIMRVRVRVPSEKAALQQLARSTT